MKINEIRSFVAVAEAESIQEAANRLHLTQSAVSRLVQRLESQIGITLFDRKTKPFRLTRDGQNALGHCRNVLKAVDNFAGAFSPSTEPSGLLRLGVAHALTAIAAHDPLDMLRAAFPSLTVHLLTNWTGQLLEQVSNGILDAALILLPEGESVAQEVNARCLGTEDVRIIGAKALTTNEPLTLSEMNEIGWVLQPEGCGYRRALKHALRETNTSLNVAVEVFGQDVQLSLVARGFGLGLAPPRFFANTPYVDRVRTLNVQGFDLNVSVWLVRARHPGNLTTLLDVLEANLVNRLHR